MPATKTAKSDSLDSIYDALHDIFSRYVPPLKIGGRKVLGKRDFHLTIPKAVVVPGAYGGKPVEIDVASLIRQKDYVGFYFMPVNMQPALKKKLAPALVATLKGKTCFHIKKLTPDLFENVEAALNAGVQLYKDRGWL